MLNVQSPPLSHGCPSAFTPSANHASAPSPFHVQNRRIAPACGPETTLKWLETRLKRLEINVETLKRFNEISSSTSMYQRLTKARPLKFRKICENAVKSPPPSPSRIPLPADRSDPSRHASAILMLGRTATSAVPFGRLARTMSSKPPEILLRTPPSLPQSRIAGALLLATRARSCQTRCRPQECV